MFIELFVINTSRTRAEKAKAQAEYTEVYKQVKGSFRTDERKYVEDLAMTAEKATKEGNMRQQYDRKKKLAGNYLPDSGYRQDPNHVVCGEPAVDDEPSAASYVDEETSALYTFDEQIQRSQHNLQSDAISKACASWYGHVQVVLSYRCFVLMSTILIDPFVGLFHCDSNYHYMLIITLSYDDRMWDY
ncbi:unnamed protein product [Schistosoma curassoni]|uniref:HMG box domain-containing protein n=1 Tax=Schistosoma curassoni TaxID=6186 RepID=A0A183KH26_9TREM|nr:unnamed protein product [Schistosoma curassoni]